MPLRITCTLCGTVVHVKKSVCVCGHTFRLQTKTQVSVMTRKELATKRKRAVESCDKTALRQRKDIIAKKRKRAIESHNETCRHRQERDRLQTARNTRANST